MKLLNGYELTTSFWDDFSFIDGSYDSEKIGGFFGALIGQLGTPKDIKELFDRCFSELKESKGCYVALTEFVAVLNLKCWFWFHKNKGSCEKSQLYNKLWLEAKSFAESNLTGKGKDFYLRVTDQSVTRRLHHVTVKSELT